MIKEYNLKTITDPSYADKNLVGEHVCLQTDKDEASAMASRFLYKKTDEKQDIGGKNMRGNTNILPGLYTDLDGKKHYIKIPNDPKEMFCEMLHGALVNELRINNYLNIEDPYISGAEGILVEVAGRKTLALSVSILPVFKELFEYLGTAKSNGKERDNFKEITNRNIYSKFVEGQLSEKPNDKEDMKRSLAMCILQSVAFFGDYSFHSSNVALYGGNMKVAKIDGGAAFRSFAKNSPVNILFPHEYTGMGFHNIIHKNYIDYYTRIPGLKEYLKGIATSYIKMINNREGRESICSIVEKSIETVKATYKKAGVKDPFGNKDFSEYFGMDLNIDQTLLAKQFEGIIYRNIEGFQRIKTSEKQNSNTNIIIQRSTEDSIKTAQLTIFQNVLARGSDAKSSSNKPSEKQKIKNLFEEKFKSNERFKTIDFLIYLHLLCAPSGSFASYSTTAEVLASGLSRLSTDDSARRYLGISSGKQKVSVSDLTKSIKNRYEVELNRLKNDPQRYPEFLIRFNGNSKVW
ncbi:hypothetical protein AB9G23_09765 [Francisella philomiragia]|uniref:hypothetical protein n=1 Tax=Francisella philomiragia TaxID=28110 RepID=UPI0019044AD7|nr:hypothetical protein [Francisella philomiragia]MBK2026536.1 hypothetical protein [Francisella philomiragia]